MNIVLKRVYRAPAPGDGTRVLVDRLWPRGLSKASAQVDLWLRSLAPSTALRRWYDHREERWPEFRARYFAELDGQPAALESLLSLCQEGTVSFVYAAKDEQRNNAVALKDYVMARLKKAESV